MMFSCNKQMCYYLGSRLEALRSMVNPHALQKLSFWRQILSDAQSADMVCFHAELSYGGQPFLSRHQWLKMLTGSPWAEGSNLLEALSSRLLCELPHKQP